MIKHLGRLLAAGAVLAAVALLGWRAFVGSQGGGSSEEDADNRIVAVEVAPISSGRIREVRVFAGTLEASARFRAAAKVGGLVESVEVDIGDTIERNAVVARLDDAEFVQAALQAEGDVAVESAERARAESALNLAQIELERARGLHDEGLVPAARLDEARAALESAKASLHLARGRVQRAAAAVELARIRRNYTEVRASWSGEEETATVAERHQEAGNTVQPGDPIVDIVKLDPLVGVITVPERDYAKLTVGQQATLTTDSVPGETFSAQIARIAPVFREASRQARIELRVANPKQLLKPGAFARIQIVLGSAEAAFIVPSAAITRRADQDVIFVVGDDETTVSMRAVHTGLGEGDRVQISPADGESVSGRVVVLGQELLGKASTVRIVNGHEDAAPGNEHEQGR